MVLREEWEHWSSKDEKRGKDRCVGKKEKSAGAGPIFKASQFPRTRDTLIPVFAPFFKIQGRVNQRSEL